MNKKKRNIVFSIVGIIIVIIYIIISATPLGKEIEFQPQWTLSITSKPQGGITSNTKIFPFQLGQNLGYFTEKGTIVKLISYPFQGTISHKYWSTYSPDVQNIEIYSTNSVSQETPEPDFSINSSGFPFISDTRLYVFTPSGYGFESYSETGEKLWGFEGYAPIISFNSSVGGVAVGYADGSLYSFTPKGELQQEFIPGGSKYPIILGVAISNSGNQVACVSGIDSQRFVLTQEKNGLHKVVFHTYLEGNLRSPAMVKFSQDEKRVYFACNEGLGVVDCETYENTILSIKGKILAIEESPDINTTFVLSKVPTGFRISLIENATNIIGSFFYKAESSFITVANDSLYIGKDTEISKILLTKK